MTDFDGPHPPDPFLTPEQQLMIDLGWLELWHAEREEGWRGPHDDNDGG